MLSHVYGEKRQEKIGKNSKIMYLALLKTFTSQNILNITEIRSYGSKDTVGIIFSKFDLTQVLHTAGTYFTSTAGTYITFSTTAGTYVIF